jgi:vacuolar-type H+-ATPase subunit H
MGREHEGQQSDAITAAIEHVLKLERDGMEQLRLSHEQAHQILSQARDRAAAIGMRADARITKLHNLYLQNLQREVDLLAESGHGSDENPANGYDRTALTQAARRLAAKLTGGA